MQIAGYIELADLQNIIRDRIGYVDQWVRVEVDSRSEVRGHHYFGLLQKSSSGEELARARAIIWKSNAGILEEFFRRTGQHVEAGISIVVRVVVQYTARYGLALIIQEIDAGFTIGLRERQKKETLARLTAEGLLDRQKSLQLPFLPSRIAVISSRDAAGYGDFMKHLSGNQYGYVFDCTLFQSLMQGDRCPSSICSGIDAALSGGMFDLILILRGGGAESDLFCYDDYEMCKAIAESPVPVLTAVGHERDYHLADMVAHSHFKTPTALADFLIEWYEGVESQVTDYLRNISDAASERIASEERMLADLSHSVRYALSGRVNDTDIRLRSVFSSLRGSFALRLGNVSSSLERVLQEICHSLGRSIDGSDRILAGIVAHIISDANNSVALRDREVDRCRANICFAMNAVLNGLDNRIALAEASIKSSDPRSILRQGYVLAVDRDGTVLKNVHSKSAGDDFSLRFTDGLWHCLIDEIKESR